MTEALAARRILVALDASARGVEALAAAAALAVELDAELAGLFVEDLELQHWAGLPFAREFSLLSGAGQASSTDDVERAWRREAEATQRELAAAAARLRLRWTFRVARGRVAAELHAQAAAYDLIVLGKQTSVRIVSFAHAGTMPGRASSGPGPVLVRVDTAASATRSLALAATLARRTGADVAVSADAADETAYRRACRDALAELETRGAYGRCLAFDARSHDALPQAARREGAACVVLAYRERELGQSGFARMLGDLRCPVVLVR